MPTTPLTASVSTALAVKHAPAIHATPRRFVSCEREHADERAVDAMEEDVDPVMEERRLLARAERPRARATRGPGSGRYEPMLRSGPRPQKSR